MLVGRLSKCWRVKADIVGVGERRKSMSLGCRGDGEVREERGSPTVKSSSNQEIRRKEDPLKQAITCCSGDVALLVVDGERACVN